MLAVTFQKPYEVAVSTVEKPKIQEPTDAIVKVSLAGLCGSDLHPYRGAEKGLDPMTIMGHEFVGTIVEVGEQVKGFQVGDRVGSGFTTCCGECWYCSRGLTCRCEKGQLYGWKSQGKGLEGGQAEYVRVPLASGSLLKLPDTIEDEEAILLGDILSTGFFCAMNGFSALTEMEASEAVVVVIGCGPVGMLACIGAKEYGAKQVFVVDSVNERLQVAADRFGATPLNLSQDVDAAVKSATGGRGADIVLEVVGHSSALELAYTVMRPGGVLSSVGVHTAPTWPFTPGDGYDKNLTYRSGRCPSRAMMDKLLPVLISKKYAVTSIISHRVPITDAVEMYRKFDGRLDGCTKVVFTMP
ncbi:hypothetical protein K450DRAFT_241667 [Umbelopsis ramanniana AG]|uniref:Enoyl reductase (ER) domain-containing protein n=1 Tax=Umbelopsis ramanniana AG TaxID=1314678 RepID=A0AAD5EC99_UMBRA|nr:uncharacterized protein K450DRAFT_241667 [Umbelopsis ramanniana AG]KAI8579580.1 hypothetical protein K450DRAFT_241667 [Umbelopsis ramanniana AG]